MSTVAPALATQSIAELTSILSRLQADRNTISRNRLIRVALVGGRGEGKTSFYIALFLFAEELHPDYILRFTDRSTIGYLDPIAKMLLRSGDVPANPATPPKTLRFSIVNRRTAGVEYDVECQDYSGHTIELLGNDEEHLFKLADDVAAFNKSCDIALWLVDAADASLDDRNIFNMMFPHESPQVALLLTKFDRFGTLPVTDRELSTAYARLKKEYPDLFSIEATALSRRAARPPAILPIAPLHGLGDTDGVAAGTKRKRKDLKPWRLQAVIDEVLKAKSTSIESQVAKLDREIHEVQSHLIHTEAKAAADEQKRLAEEEERQQAIITGAVERMHALEEEIDQANVLGVLHSLLWSDHWKSDARQIYDECLAAGISRQSSDWYRQVQRKIWTKQIATGAVVIVVIMAGVVAVLWLVLGSGVTATR